MKNNLTKTQVYKVVEFHVPTLVKSVQKTYEDSKPKKDFVNNLKASNDYIELLPYVELAESALLFNSSNQINITLAKFKKTYNPQYLEDAEKMVKLYSSLLPNKSSDIVDFVLQNKLLQKYIDIDMLNELLAHGDRVKKLTPYMSDIVANSILGKLDEAEISLEAALEDPFAFTKTRFIELKHRRQKANIITVLSNEQADALSLIQKDDYYRFYNTFVYTLDKILTETVSTYAIGYKEKVKKFNNKTKKYENDDAELVLNQVQYKINRNCDKITAKKIHIGTYKNIWLNNMQESGLIRFYDNKYFFIDDYEDELELEKVIKFFIRQNKRIKKHEVPPGFQVDAFVTNDEGYQISLSNEQLETAKKVASLKSGLAVITGRAGSGKTTVTEKILKIRKDLGLLTNDPTDAIFCAPMGIASKRLGSALGQSEATTIHAAVNLPYISKAKLVVIDETGFADMDILLAFLRKVNKNALLIFLGDKNQLAPVARGMFLRDIENNIFKDKSFKFDDFYSLGTVFRQGAHSAILTFANNILDGQLQAKGSHDLIFEPEIKDFEIGDLLMDYEYFKNYKNTQVLSIMKEGQGGVHMINNIIQKKMHHFLPNRDKYVTNTYNNKFYIGDKVIVNQSIYRKDVVAGKIYNGEIGYIESISSNNTCSITFDFGTVMFKESELNNVLLAYCTSVHKTQGGGWKNVIFLCQQKHIYLATRNLLYTGVTRAKEKLIICSEPRTLKIAIFKQEINKRKTDVGNKIREAN